MALKARDKVIASAEIAQKYPSEVDANGYFVSHPETELNQVVGLARQNSTAYVVGNIAFSASILPLFLKCTTAGTTAATEPSFSGATIGGTVTDGSVVWTYESMVVDLSSYAKLASPTFTGTPTAPTPIKSTDTTQIATTAYVKTNLGDYAPKDSPAFTGTPTAPTAETSTNNTQIATTAFVKSNLSSYAPKDSPAFTGTPTAPTQVSSDNSTKIATTEFVKTAMNGIDLSAYAPKASPAFTGTPTAPTASTSTNSTQIATTAYVKSNLSSYAPINSPTFTGTPKSTTPSSGDNSTNIATTAFVQTEVSGYAPIYSPTFTGTPKVPTAGAGTNTTQIATTAFVQTAISSAGAGGIVADSLAQNGYAKFYDGLIVQWGRSTSTGSIGTVSVSFPIKFPSACYSVATSGNALSAQFTSTSQVTGRGACVDGGSVLKDSISSSGFTCASERQISWCAFGK